MTDVKITSVISGIILFQASSGMPGSSYKALREVFPIRETLRRFGLRNQNFFFFGISATTAAPETTRTAAHSPILALSPVFGDL